MSQPAVLIVEDDANLREALFDTLNSDELPVLTAESGPAALEILDSNAVGLVVSDLQMEPMDGATLLAKIRDRHPTLPAVLMTAYGTIENAVDVMRKHPELINNNEALHQIIKQQLEIEGLASQPI